MSKVNYAALGDNILVDPDFKEKTEGGIIVPEHIQEENKDTFLEVLSVGEKVENIKVGDKITFHHAAQPTTILINNKKFLNFKTYDVLGKLN